jgi:thiamine-phosphate pyrophosphorylase
VTAPPPAVAAVRVVVITDRRLCADDALVRRVAAIATAVPRGTVAFQVREKDLDGGPLLALVRDVLAVARPHGAPVWVNDRVDVALLAGADGAHLPEHGLSLADARAAVAAAGRALELGCSRHDVAGVRAAAGDGAAWVQLGPVWATPGKGAPIGTAPFAARAELPATTRLIAVGGIDGPARASEVAAAGTDAVAVIRAAWHGDDPAAAIAALVASVSPRGA